MNESEKHLAATAIIALGASTVILLIATSQQRKRIKNLTQFNSRLVSWSQIAQKLLLKQALENPDSLGDLPEELAIDVTAYNIFKDNNLL